MNDRELIREIQRGKKEYLNTIAEKYYDDIYRFCCCQTGSSQDAGDLTQETFLHFIRSVEHYHYRNLKGYLLTIARNVCVDYFRSRKRKQEKEAFWQQEISGREENVVKARSQQEELLITVQQLTEELPQMQREAMILYYGYGFKYREIARMTETGIGTVKSRIRQGTEKLKKSLNKGDLQ
ncbi:RNA polymerase sigma factor [Petralouisia muris]|uniref:RNA polymerase sigma factor n=1 Tax=Petralouisia muris TaxID=3032872 RepID=A0AC61S0I5_9FIRM|nr:RNA polymerase sigma factor [Petralouisia muris]TGY97946.1 RNA polymerase sigma factor [Petralouisia muris]